MPRFIYPKRIQIKLNELARLEKKFFKDHPGLRHFLRTTMPEELEAQEYRSLFEPDQVFMGCSGCAVYVLVLSSPEHKKILHFFTNTKMRSTKDFDQIVPGLSILARATTEEDFERVSKMIFEETSQPVATPFTYSQVQV